VVAALVRGDEAARPVMIGRGEVADGEPHRPTGQEPRYVLIP
jgi:hypothetical protein